MQSMWCILSGPSSNLSAQMATQSSLHDFGSVQHGQVATPAAPQHGPQEEMQLQLRSAWSSLGAAKPPRAMLAVPRGRRSSSDFLRQSYALVVHSKWEPCKTKRRRRGGARGWAWRSHQKLCEQPQQPPVPTKWVRGDLQEFQPSAATPKGSHAESPPRRVKSHVPDRAKRCFLVYFKMVVRCSCMKLRSCQAFARNFGALGAMSANLDKTTPTRLFRRFGLLRRRPTGEVAWSQVGVPTKTQTWTR